jgi:NADPH:quinone reductase-like Zn-dependent oxidoreductase
MTGLTALLGLELHGLPAGASGAVTGGAGLLGSYVIVLAGQRGLRVIADAKPEDEALVRGFGADEVVPRGGLPERGADGVFDTALLNAAALPAIRDGGGLAVVRGWDGDDPAERGIRVHAVRVATVLERTDWLEHLREAGIPLRVAGEYPPEQAAEAHRVMDAGGLRGRAVIVF